MKEAEDKTVDESAIKVKKPRKKKEPGEAKPKKVKAKKIEKTLYDVFAERLRTIRLEDIKKPWMATKSFRLLDTIEAVQAWVDTILSDPKRAYTIPHLAWTGPVIAVDTETDGLDIRVVKGKVKTKLAGVCLSADGLEGIYIPVGHESNTRTYEVVNHVRWRLLRRTYKVRNVPKVELARILQQLFDRSHLVFFNAKFDREVLRLMLGLTFRDYPHFEDVQVLNYLYDPKARIDDKGAGGLQFGGLKALSKQMLGIEQIELDELTKVKARVFNIELRKYTQRMVYAPFTWVPPSMALWYAAGDAITTWLLWQNIHALQDFSKMSGVHRLDHQLIDTLTWIERQRVRLDGKRLADTITFHDGRVKELTEELGRIAGIENFNPGSTPQLRKILFEDRNMEVIETSEKSGDASTAIGVLKELKKRYPDDEFLGKLMDFREYAALHPGSIQYDPNDQTARFYFKQNVVAGGRLAAAGGEWDKDGGCGINPQAIKKVGGNWWVKGKPVELADEEFTQFEEADLDPSCFDKDKKKAPNIENNHIATYFGKRYCVVPKCECHTTKTVKVDANEVINLRGMFSADPGWTIFSIDYSNIEMRVAANISKEPLFIKEFLEGSGDFHTLTAIALFPEFSDSATAKGRKKELRGVAKIINFALLYGGTAYTIHENMNKAGFNVSFEEAQELVQRYWDSVPTFAAWCMGKRETARSKLICKTPTGRVIHFESAMKGFGIVEPLPEHKEKFWAWRSMKKQVDEFLRCNMREEARAVKAQMDSLWRDPESGVKNMSEYNRFLGKAERVAINIPLQGTAGDLMRSALNRIRVWAMNNPGVEKVFRLHLTVHDEIDFSVKNEFVPYILPRINRLMKLRPLHEKKGWIVPIETDCEYGQTWDVQHHLTGDDGHKAAAWLDIEGLESYVPPAFDEDIVDRIEASWKAGECERVKQWLGRLHPRVQNYITPGKDQYLGQNSKSPEEPHQEVDDLLSKSLRRIVTIMLQLHEFWIIDEDEKEDMMVQQYAEDMGLEFPDEPLIGELDGYLASIPVEDAVFNPPMPTPPERPKKEPIPEPTPESHAEPPAESEPEEPMTADETEELFHEPKPKILPVLRVFKRSEMDMFKKVMGIGAGPHTIDFRFAGDGKVRQLPNTQLSDIPKEWLA